MPKKYEDEIRDILRGMDRFPDDGPSRTTRRAGAPSLRGLGMRLPDLQKLMGAALIMILFGWLMQQLWAWGFGPPLLVRAAGYVSLLGTILMIVCIAAMLLRGGVRGGGGTQQRWRGQVIHFPNRQGPLNRLRHSIGGFFSRLTRRRPNGPGRGGFGGPRRTPPGSGGRDSFQW